MTSVSKQDSNRASTLGKVMNWKIAAKELAISGTDENPLFRDKRMLAIIWQTLRGNHDLVKWLVNECDDVVSAQTLPELAEKMRAHWLMMIG